MWNRSVVFMLVFGLVALIGVTGAGSAAMRTPDRAALALLTFEQSIGTLTPMICGDATDRKPHCPLCHGLPEGANSRHDAVVFRLVPHISWARGEDLTRAAQGRNINHSPRAPPAVV